MDYYSQRRFLKKKWNPQKNLPTYCLFLVSTAFAIELPMLSEVRMHAGLMMLAVLADI